MENEKMPDWTKSATRLTEPPKVDRWYRPEEGGIVAGTLEWKGEETSRFDGETQYVYVVRGEDGSSVGVRERAQLRRLRAVKIGSRICVRATGKKELDAGRTMWEFDVLVAEGTPIQSGSPVAATNGLPF